MVDHFNSQSHEETDQALSEFSCVVEYFNSQSHEETDGNL